MNLLWKNNIIIGPEVARRVLKQCEQEKIDISEKLMQVLTAVQSDWRFRAMPLVSLTEKEIDIIKKEIKKFMPSLHKKLWEDLSLWSFYQYILGNFVYYKDKETVDPDLTLNDQKYNPGELDLKKYFSGFLPYRAWICEYVAEHCLQKDGYVQFDSKKHFENRLKAIFWGVLPESLQKQLAKVRKGSDTIIMRSAYRFIPTPPEDWQLCTIQRDIEATCLYDCRTKKLLLTYDFPTMKEWHACLRRITPNRWSWHKLLDHKSDAVEELSNETLEAFSQYDRFLNKKKVIYRHPKLRNLLLARRDVQDETTRQNIFQRIQANEVWKMMMEKHNQVDGHDKITSFLSGSRWKTFTFVYYQKELWQNEKGYAEWQYPPIHDNHALRYTFPLLDIVSICKWSNWTIPVDESIKASNPKCSLFITIIDEGRCCLRIEYLDNADTYFECIITVKEIFHIAQFIDRVMWSDVLFMKLP